MHELPRDGKEREYWTWENCPNQESKVWCTKAEWIWSSEKEGELRGRLPSMILGERMHRVVTNRQLWLISSVMNSAWLISWYPSPCSFIHYPVIGGSDPVSDSPIPPPIAHLHPLRGAGNGITTAGAAAGVGIRRGGMWGTAWML